MIPRNTDDGLVLCGAKKGKKKCNQILCSDENGDMPQKCPRCGEVVDWGGWVVPWNDPLLNSQQKGFVVI